MSDDKRVLEDADIATAVIFHYQDLYGPEESIAMFKSWMFRSMVDQDVHTLGLTVQTLERAMVVMGFLKPDLVPGMLEAAKLVHDAREALIEKAASFE